MTSPFKWCRVEALIFSGFCSWTKGVLSLCTWAEKIPNRHNILTALQHELFAMKPISSAWPEDWRPRSWVGQLQACGISAAVTAPYIFFSFSRSSFWSLGVALGELLSLPGHHVTPRFLAECLSFLKQVTSPLTTMDVRLKRGIHSVASYVLVHERNVFFKPSLPWVSSALKQAVVWRDLHRVWEQVGQIGHIANVME